MVNGQDLECLKYAKILGLQISSDLTVTQQTHIWDRKESKLIPVFPEPAKAITC